MFFAARNQNSCECRDAALAFALASLDRLGDHAPHGDRNRTRLVVHAVAVAILAAGILELVHGAVVLRTRLPHPGRRTAALVLPGVAVRLVVRLFQLGAFIICKPPRRAQSAPGADSALIVIGGGCGCK